MSLPTKIYATAECSLAVLIVLSNVLVLWVFLRRRQIRTPANTYIFSLAMTDFLAGLLGIPLTVWSVLTRWPHSFNECLGVHLILCVLCTVSTFHLLAIAVDKYLTICGPPTHWLEPRMRANFFIGIAWIFGSAIGLLPMFDAFGFASSTRSRFRGECHFTSVVDFRYLVYVIFFATIIIPSIIIIFCYSCIYHQIRDDERSVDQLLRHTERNRRLQNRKKIIRTLMLLVFTYAFCWFPLYLLNTFEYFFGAPTSPIPTLCTVVLSHANCALNPLIYAYGVPGFKCSLRRFFGIRSATVKSPLGANASQAAITSRIQRELSSNGRSFAVERKPNSPRNAAVLAQLGRSGDSVDTYLAPSDESARRELRPIHESESSLSD